MCYDVRHFRHHYRLRGYAFQHPRTVDKAVATCNSSSSNHAAVLQFILISKVRSKQINNCSGDFDSKIRKITVRNIFKQAYCPFQLCGSLEKKKGAFTFSTAYGTYKRTSIVDTIVCGLLATVGGMYCSIVWPVFWRGFGVRSLDEEGIIFIPLLQLREHCSEWSIRD